MDAASARAAFPRGLAQPESGFRFGLDALLLASFASLTTVRSAVDLGCGCGPVGLGLLLRKPEGLAVTGLEIDPDAAGCAARNAALLGFAGSFSIAAGSVAEPKGAGLAAEAFDLALANPPYREPGSGRKPDSGLQARFQSQTGLSAFCAAASWLIRPRARAAMVFPADRLHTLLNALDAAGLAPKRLLPVYARPGREARLVLVESVKHGRPGLVLEPPLTLHPESGREYTGQALAFCPFLACNAASPCSSD